MILRRFLYLDTPAVDGYLSAIEDGSRQTVERQSEHSGSIGVSAGVGPVSGQASRGRGRSQAETATDTPEAKFSRLSSLAQKYEDTWTEVLEPDMLGDFRKGEIIEIEVDLYVPDIVRFLEPGGASEQLLTTMDRLANATSLFGPLDGMPSAAQREEMRTAISALPVNLMVVGEVADSNWQIAGQLNREHLRDASLDGTAIVVGKIANSWSAGQWKPLMALPGMSLLPRNRRRELERQRPTEGSEDQYLEGPAVTLDIIAIHR